MAPPASRQPSRVKRIWVSAGSRKWTGFARFAPHLQLLSLFLAVIQVALGCYILGSLLQYRKWTETCHSAFAHDPGYVPQTLRPPFTIYTQDNYHTGTKKHWIGNFSALEENPYLMACALILPIATLIMALNASCCHHFASPPHLRLALCIGLWQVVDPVLYLCYAASSLTVDWAYEDKAFEGASVCFVGGERGRVIEWLAKERIGAIGTSSAIAMTAGCVAVAYLGSTILGIYRAARDARIERHTYTANVILQELPSDENSRQERDIAHGDSPRAEPIEERAAGHAQRRNTEALTDDNDPLDDPVHLYAEPVRPREMV
ncbi:hypothetical protein P171DRAFT_522741 [Karstenula rhodostoma CBS 690.94]|uniref:Uncharacterized protein n=1 Tax=Karstenula rhodostoma CBS 690.94 TaxID=1392251 RepID=A0A9P4UB94_9PLEO|nr:hypothetical protein P171DRAFT_522741 [Karstenula rhodostoma CBS 690.94]